MPSNVSSSVNGAVDDIRTLTFEDFETSVPQSTKEAVQIPEDGDTKPDDDQPPLVSKRKLYLMVLGDFGLSFTWLCKFAVATYVDLTPVFRAFLLNLLW